jgi:hypothetical protein
MKENLTTLASVPLLFLNLRTADRLLTANTALEFSTEPHLLLLFADCLTTHLPLTT